jgi:hypothetical protein
MKNVVRVKQYSTRVRRFCLSLPREELVVSSYPETASPAGHRNFGTGKFSARLYLGPFPIAASDSKLA